MEEGKFFFEEDPQSSANDINWVEHSDTFYNQIKDMGILQKESLSPHGVSVDMEMQKMETSFVRIEYGIVRQDYVIHTIPTHHRKNFSTPEALKKAMYQTVTRLQAVIPNDLQVDIYPPQPEWEVKAISYIVRRGADAWNLDREKLEKEILPQIKIALTEVCNSL
jgi:hypothetical protein